MAIEALVAQEETLQRNRDQTLEQARVVGRISLFLDSVRLSEDDGSLERQIRQLREQIDVLAAGLSDDVVDDRLASILQVIGRDMSTWAQHLGLEHSEWPVGLDLNAKNPTVIAHRPTGPVRLNKMGGGKNYMGYHVVTHLALQKLFRERTRPVPGLLMLDQPTQVYYPADTVLDRSVEDLGEDDQTSVKRLFKLIFDATAKVSPDLQVIIMDHADIAEPWFQEAVVEKWRGRKLVPKDWYSPPDVQPPPDESTPDQPPPDSPPVV